MATSKASQPVVAGEAPGNTVPHITFQDSMNAAAAKIDALLRGGVDCVTYIASALLVGYLANAGAKVKLSVMKDEFALALKKKGLGGTQTKKYLDYGTKIAAQMFKECQYGMEMAALLAATKPDGAHAAVVAWLKRHTNGKKTEHGTKLNDATVKLNVLGIFLGTEDDPGKPETLAPTEEQKAQAKEKSRTAVAEKITKDMDILKQVPADKLVSTMAEVISFAVLVTKHVSQMTVATELKKERDEIMRAYDARIKALSVPMGKAAKKADQPETSAEAA